VPGYPELILWLFTLAEPTYQMAGLRAQQVNASGRSTRWLIDANVARVLPAVVVQAAQTAGYWLALTLRHDAHVWVWRRVPAGAHFRPAGIAGPSFALVMPGAQVLGVKRPAASVH
jgi:hypothetical protein